MPEPYQHILYNVQGRIALITLNRPEKLNAWSPRMEVEFMDALNTASADTNVHVIVVTGAGRAFCAGGDIQSFNDRLHGEFVPPSGPTSLIAREGSPEVPQVLARSKPVIAAINGHAVGIGLTMPLACDIRIASDQAKFSVRFVRVGLTPECGSTRYLPLVAGLGNALYMALTGATIDADEALRRGLVDRVVPHDKLMDEAMAVASEIAANPPGAVWAAKRLMHESGNQSDLRTAVSMEGFAIREARRHPDHAEAVKAFIEKRPPQFGAQGGAK